MGSWFCQFFLPSLLGVAQPAWVRWEGKARPGHLLHPAGLFLSPVGMEGIALGVEGVGPLCLISAFLSSLSLHTGPAGLVSGDQRVQVAKGRAQQNHTLLERELQRRKEQVRASAVLPGVQIKEEPLSEEEEEEEEQALEEGEPMDTSPSGGLHGRLTNGLPAGWAAGGDSFNGHPPPSCASSPVAQELRAFVEATFQRQFVLTLSELKRLFNLHLASLPPGHTLFSGISDRMLQDTVLAAGCKQILVPVSGARTLGGWAGRKGPERSLVTPEWPEPSQLWGSQHGVWGLGKTTDLGLCLGSL